MFSRSELFERLVDQLRVYHIAKSLRFTAYQILVMVSRVSEWQSSDKTQAVSSTANIYKVRMHQQDEMLGRTTIPLQLHLTTIIELYNSKLHPYMYIAIAG